MPLAVSSEVAGTTSVPAVNVVELHVVPLITLTEYRNEGPRPVIPALSETSCTWPATDGLTVFTAKSA